MSPTDDKLEIRIGKLLDGEITPAEQRWLDEELLRNDEARRLLEQLRMLHEASCCAVASEVLEKGSNPDDILLRLWRNHGDSPRRRVFRVDGHLRFAAGLAAGFLLGLLLHFALVSGDRAGTSPPAGGPTARDVIGAGTPSSDVGENIRTRYPQPVVRNVDWYSFTDRSGRQWLIEGVREGSIRPAVYAGDL